MIWLNAVTSTSTRQIINLINYKKKFDCPVNWDILNFAINNSNNKFFAPAGAPSGQGLSSVRVKGVLF